MKVKNKKMQNFGSKHPGLYIQFEEAHPWTKGHWNCQVKM